MSVQVLVAETATVETGRSVDSIARRLYGRRAFVYDRVSLLGRVVWEVYRYADGPDRHLEFMGDLYPVED